MTVKISTTFAINGERHTVNAASDTPLLWVLREQLKLTGTKFGCGVGQCGACTVHVNGEAVRSCAVPVSAVAGRKVTTLEGLGSGGRLHPVQQAFVAAEGNHVAAAAGGRRDTATTGTVCASAVTASKCARDAADVLTVLEALMERQLLRREGAAFSPLGVVS